MDTAARVGRAVRSVVVLSLALFIGCGEAAPAPAVSVASVEPPAVAATSVPPSAEPDEPAPDVAPVTSGEVHWIRERGARIDDVTPAVFIEIDALPQPESEVFGRFGLHDAHRVLRLIDEVAGPESVVIAGRDGTCEARVTRARRLHTLWVSDFAPRRGESREPREPRTYLALDFEGCETGAAGIVGLPPADVHTTMLRLEDLTTPATPTLIEGVRHVDDDAYGRGPLPSDAFRMVEVPAHGVTIVVGNVAWLVRDGVVLTAGADPIVLIEAGPLLLFLLQSASEEEIGSLAAFAPHYVPRACEVIDDSGSAMNVRAGPRGNATVVTSVPAGTRVTANDMSGSWFHLATSPPGWGHQRGLRCDPLEVALRH